MSLDPFGFSHIQNPLASPTNSLYAVSSFQNRHESPDRTQDQSLSVATSALPRNHRADEQPEGMTRVQDSMVSLLTQEMANINGASAISHDRRLLTPAQNQSNYSAGLRLADNAYLNHRHLRMGQRASSSVVNEAHHQAIPDGQRPCPPISVTNTPKDRLMLERHKPPDENSSLTTLRMDAVLRPKPDLETQSVKKPDEVGEDFPTSPDKAKGEDGETPQQFF